MAQSSPNQELVDRFVRFYRNYYRDAISQLAQRYPNEQRSLHVDYDDLYQFDQDLADDYLSQPDQLEDFAEEALRVYDLPADVSLGQAHVRLRNLPETVDIRSIRVHDNHVGRLIAVSGIVRKATDVRPKITEAAFECQRCGTMTYIPQSDGGFQEPHECQGCERQGPFRVNFDQSEFVDSQKLRVQESPEGLRGGETPQSIDIDIEDDITGKVTAGDHVTVTGVLHIDQVTEGNEKSQLFDLYMDGVSVEIEDEQFEDMEISEADKRDIVELSGHPDIYEEMVGSVAPSIYGYDEEKLAMILQLFSGVTKTLPDGSRIRGDLHMLLIGDPGTGKSQMLSYIRNIAPRSVYTSGKGSSSAGLCVTGDTLLHTADGFTPIRELAEPHHPEPVATESSKSAEYDLYTFDRANGEMTQRTSSHVWRMPEKQCRRIETAHGKELETSTNTPVLVCGDDGIEWSEMADIETGDFVAVPKYDDLERSTPSPRAFFEFSAEKLKPTEESIVFLRQRLRERFGTLRNAAVELELTEDFIYDSLSNRHLPLSGLDRILDAIDADRSDIDVARSMLGHGNSLTVPDSFSADLMYLVGLVFGDGDIMVSRRGGNRGHVRISNSDEALLREAARIVEKTFDKSVEIERPDERVPCVRIHSATIARFFRNLGMESPKDDLSLDPRLTTAEHADAFLRGLFDADGSVSARDDGGSSIQFSTISDKFARQVQLMLELYGVRARRRERDRRGTYELENGHEIESKAVQTHLAMYGQHVDSFAERIGFESAAKTAALGEIVGDTERRGERLPVGNVLATASVPAGAYYQNIYRGDNPSRERARAMLAERDLGSVESSVREAADASLLWDEVVAAVDTGTKELFDLTVPETNNFVGNGIITHNTAAAVRDDFGEGQQWSLEAGALVLADQGIAAVDELDKMRCVTGDTLVHLADGSIRRIEALARDAAETGSVETLDNGRTIRGTDFDVWTMADDGRLISRPVSAVHEYEAPDTLTEVRLETGERLTATNDHPFFVFEDGERVERAAADLDTGDQVYVPRGFPRTAADGGVTPTDTPTNQRPEAGEKQATGDVSLRRLVSVTSVDASEYPTADDKPRVYDLTVDGTHNFVANGMVVHNSEDRSAMHQALEQQEISISKAGINATLKSRCSLLGAANPKYGRFDQYEPIGEQIDLEPALISRFDLIFTVTDQPDPDEDAALAEHILRTNYAGELETQRTQVANSNYSAEEVASVTDTVEPAIDPDLLRKYIAYAKRTCFPTMTDSAKEAIRDFYVDLRAKGADEDAPVPVTARKLEALVRLAEASARVRLSDTVESQDATRATDIVRSCLQDIGVDPETGEFDADVIETGTSKSQRDRIKSIKDVIETVDAEYEKEAGAPLEAIVERAEAEGIEESKVMDQIEQLRRKGDLYSPKTDQYKVV